MFSKKSQNEFPFVSNYFVQCFNHNRFPQSIVFEGLDPYAQLFFALELARIANCTQDKNPDCDCLNCRWIRSNTHPAINFVSQLHFKPQDDDAKTVISAKQAKAVEKELHESSDYHRFFIFFDAKSTPMSDSAIKSYEKYCPEGFEIIPDNDWSLFHIDKKTFNETVPNILLKSVEEPPERTTFVFLTKNKADLINTIVSRSQVFKLNAKYTKENNNFIFELFSNYPKITCEQAISISDEIQNYIKENEIRSSVVLDNILAYLSDVYKNTGLKKAKDDIKHISQAHLWANSSMSDKVIFDTLMLQIVRGENG